MTSYLLIFLLILTGGAFSLIENAQTRRTAYVVYLCFAVPILLLFAGLRAPYVDADFGLYTDWYGALVDGTLAGNLFLKDPTFALVSFGVHFAGLGIATLIAIYSVACLGTQMLFAGHVFGRRWLPLGIFLIFCRFFIAHEMTQIRVSVAIPLLSLALFYFFSGKTRRGIGIFALALCFHLSVLLALPLCVAGALGMNFQSRRWLVGLGLAAIAGYVSFSRLALLLALFARTSDYVTGVYDSKSNSLLSFYLLCRVAMLLWSGLFLWKRLSARERPFLICSAFGVMLEVTLASNDTLSLRSGELFGLIDITSALIVIPYLQRRTVTLYVLLLLCLGGLFFRSSTKIINPYASRLESFLPQ